MPSLRSSLLSIGAPVLLSVAFHGGALAVVSMFKPADSSTALTPLDVTFVAPAEPVAAPMAPAESPEAEQPVEEAKTEPAETPVPEPEPPQPVIAEALPPTPEVALPPLPELVPLTLPNLAENSVDRSPDKTGKSAENTSPPVIPPVSKPDSAPRKLAEKPKPKPPKPLAKKQEPKPERPSRPRQLATRESEGSDGTGGTGTASKGVAERSGGPSGAEAIAYRGLVGSHLARFKRYPDSARARNAEGVPAVSFSLDGAGRVVSVSLARSTGQGDLDAEVVQMVRRASPFPTPPPGATRSFTIPVRYKVD